MRLKTTKRLLNLGSLSILGTAAAVGYWGITPLSGIANPADDAIGHVAQSPVHEKGTSSNNSSGPPSAAGFGGASRSMNWARTLRRPLFDPPPPAPIVVVKPPPQPIRAKLLATEIESENSTAMLKLVNGQVVFHKVGDPLGADEPGAVISKIETGAILVRRGTEELRLSVDGTNGK